MITQGLGLLAFILGIYIIFFNGIFFSSKRTVQPVPKYQLACYLTNSSINHYNTIKQQIDQINYEYQRERRKLQVIELYTMESIKGSTKENDKFSKEIGNYDQVNIDLANHIDKYINIYIADKLKKKQSYQLQQALNSASKAYQKCKKAVLLKDVKFNVQKCEQDWQNYKKCKENFDLTNLKLSQALNKRKQFMKKLEKFIQTNMTSSKGSLKIKNSNDTYQKQLNHLQKEQQRIQSYLSILFKNKNQTQFQLKTKSLNFDHSNNLYQQCKKSRLQFTYCMGISQDVKTLNINIEVLQKKIEQKKKILKRFKDLIDQTEDQTNRKNYQGYWTKNYEDLKEIVNLYIETKSRTSGSCGCSQKQEQDHLQKLKLNEALVAQAKKQLENQDNLILNTQNQLKKIKAKRQKLISEYQEQTNKSKKTNNQKLKQSNKNQQQLKKMNDNIIELNNEIISYQSQLQNSRLKCKSLEEKMSEKLPYINNVSDCISKGYYLIQLRKLAKKQELDLQQSNELFEAKKLLIRYLQNIEY